MRVTWQEVTEVEERVLFSSPQYITNDRPVVELSFHYLNVSMQYLNQNNHYLKLK